MIASFDGVALNPLGESFSDYVAACVVLGSAAARVDVVVDRDLLAARTVQVHGRGLSGRYPRVTFERKF